MRGLDPLQLLQSDAQPTETEQADGGARCRVCPQLFPRTERKAAASAGRDTNMVSIAICRSISVIGAQGEWYTGKAGPKGSISAGLAAGVPEAVLFMHCGHAQDRAARTYMHFSSPELLFATSKAFKL